MPKLSQPTPRKKDTKTVTTATHPGGPGTTAFSRDDADALVARVESTEETLELISSSLRRINVANTAALAKLETVTLSIGKLQESVNSHEKLLAGLEAKFPAEATRVETLIQDAAPAKATLVRPLVSYKTKTPGAHKLRVTLGTPTGTTNYELLGASVSASAVFVLSVSEDRTRHVLTLECEDFAAYQDFCPRHVSLAHMLSVCFPDGKFTFSELVVV